MPLENRYNDINQVNILGRPFFILINNYLPLIFQYFITSNGTNNFNGMDPK